MRTDYRVVASTWEKLAKETYEKAMSLGDDREAIVEVYTKFRDEESKLFTDHGWTYESFREETLKMSGVNNDDGG